MWRDPMDELIEDLERVVAKHTGGACRVPPFDFLEFQRETDELLYSPEAQEEMTQRMLAKVHEQE